MKKQYLLCIRGRPAKGLHEGSVYTLYSQFHCGCGRNHRPMLMTEEIPSQLYSGGLMCAFCHVRFQCERHPFPTRWFIPINDPDHKDDVPTHTYDVDLLKERT